MNNMNNANDLNNNTNKRGRRKVRFVRIARAALFSIVALLLLASMLLSTMLGTVRAEYFKGFSQKLDFEAIPDLPWEYWLCSDPVFTTSGKLTKYNTNEHGTYENANSIVQRFYTGKADNAPYYNYLKIKVPVTQEGYYNVSFNAAFWPETTVEGTDGSTVTGYFNVGANSAYGIRVNSTYGLEYSVGCQFYSNWLNEKTPDLFGVWDAYVHLMTISENGNHYFYGSNYNYSIKPLLEGKGHYQWKTLTPTVAEDAVITFHADAADVEAGFKIWYWDFSGLLLNTYYELHIDNISIERLKPNDASRPYIEFPDTKYVNNIADIGTDTYTANVTRPNLALGTFVTQGSYDSLTMQLNPLWNQTGKTSSTPMSFSIPMKNIKKNTDYKVSFDFSITNQAITSPYGYNVERDNLFKSDVFLKSYLHDGAVSVDTRAEHNTQIETVTCANKIYANKEMTSYDDIYDSYSGFLNFTTAQEGSKLSLKRTKTDENGSYIYDNNGIAVKEDLLIEKMTRAEALNLGNTYWGADNTIENLNNIDTINGINWLNALRYTEHCGEKTIEWLTFYNTTFTFNITDGVTDDGNGYCADLNWVWALDGLVPGNCYKIKIENVRIEEVEQYGSLMTGGNITIGDTKCLEYLGKAHFDTLTRGGYIKSTFFGSNGTGQNYTPRGYHSDIALSGNNIFGTMYDAGDLIIKDNDGNSDNDYTISLRGYAAVKGGVEKYVWSADGGKTWNDMSYPSLSDGSVSLRAPNLTSVGEPERISRFCESFVDQGFEGIHDYSNKVNFRFRNTTTDGYGDYGTIKDENRKYVFDTVIRYHSNGDVCDGSTCNSTGCSGLADRDTTDPYLLVSSTMPTAQRRHVYSADVKDVEKGVGDFVDFLYGVDDVNSVFIDMVADLSAYKNEANLDIIFAAVPRTNKDARCEIMRIINYNPMPNYRTYTLNIKSDITVNYKSNTSSTLSAYYDTEGLPTAYPLERVDDGVRENNESFSRLHGINLKGESGRTGGYIRSLDGFTSYENMRTIYSGVPIKNALTIYGWALVEGGTENYYWSTDYGENWKQCTEVIGNDTEKIATDVASQRANWYDGGNSLVNTTAEPHFANKIYFDGYKKSDGNNTGLTADLTAHVGKTVDVIFAAKSNKGGPYCPVARIDNVAVWGTGEEAGKGMGPFYSMIRDCYVDGVNIDPYVGTDRKGWDDAETYDGGHGQWNIAAILPAQAYHINCSYDVYNTDFTQARKRTKLGVDVKSGSKISINGMVMCHGGVKKYKFSLDGGSTWLDIPDVVGSKKDSRALYYANKVDSTFGDDDDFEHSNFFTVYNDNDTSSMLEFYLPAQTPGAVRELLVVAEGTNGYDYPILALTLRIADTTPALAYYQRGGVIKRIDSSGVNTSPVANAIYKGYNALDEAVDMPAYVESEKNCLNNITAGDLYTASKDCRYRLTVPVSETGKHKVRFWLSVVDAAHNTDNSGYTGTAPTNFNINAYLLHDNGDKTYYNDMTRQITEANRSNYANQIAASVIIKEPFYRRKDATGYDLYIDITPEDLGRGYVVLDFDLTELYKQGSTYKFKLYVDYKGCTKVD